MASTRATIRTAAHAARAALVAALLAVPAVRAADALRATDEVILSRSPDIDKLPRLAGDWCCWTSDRDETTSSGNVMLARLSTGELWRLCDGCLPDVDVLPDGDVRVAYLQIAADGIAVCSVTVPAASPTTPTEQACLAHGLRWADHVRVCGDVTVFSATDADGALRIFACSGALPAVPISREGQAFRPEAVRDARGAVHCVWDAYRPAPGQLDYEVYHAVRGRDGRWSPPLDVSGAPYGMDTEPSATAASDGGLWLTWASNRGGRMLSAFLEHLGADGSVLLPPAWPTPGGATGDPPPQGARLRTQPEDWRGTVMLKDLRAMSDPRVIVDGSGRLWLFVTGHSTSSLAAGSTLVGRKLSYLVLDADGWSGPHDVAEGALDATHLSGEAVADDPLAVRIVYQADEARAGNLQTATRVLREPRRGPSSGAPVALPLQAPAGPPLPARQALAPDLPEMRTLERDGRTFRLDFADLHCHTCCSPDGTGERDAALFFARDVARLDAVAITDHDERLGNPLTDWEYELGRRLVDLFDAPDFIAFMGFEWTNDAPLRRNAPEGSEVAGHRNCIDSRCCYRYTDPAVHLLPELYARLHAEDAIDMPHHLGLFGGASFLQTDPVAQPVIEISSEHGEFEREFWHALLQHDLTAGVVSGGDDHTAQPGTAGLAGVWVEEHGPAGDVTVDNSSPRAAFKDALRQRRCLAARKDGLWIDAQLDGAPPGAVLHLPAGAPHELHLHVSLSGIAPEDRGQGLLVNLVRDGDFEHPLWSEPVTSGRAFEADAVIPALDHSATLMLRVGQAGSCLPEHTLLWESPFRVDID